MRIRALLVLALAVAVAPATAAAHVDVRTAPPSLRQLARSIVDAGAPGAVVLVRDANGVRAGVAGFANLRTRERLRSDHAFRVGSITKTYVATVVLRLVAEGVLRLEDPVERWLPALVPNGDKITLRMLLNHTSGIYNYTDDPDFLRAVAENLLEVWLPSELVALATRHRPQNAPGTFWAYSNTGYILLGLVIEHATGTTLEEQLRRTILAPLALARTGLPATPTLTPPFAHGYLLPGPGSSRRVDVTLQSPSWAWAAGAVVSTAADLARFYGALLGRQLLEVAQLEAMQTTVSTGTGIDYGLGLTRIRLSCGTAWGHGGSVFGYTSLAYSAADGSRQAIVLVNASVTSTIAARFERALGSAFCR